MGCVPLFTNLIKTGKMLYVDTLCKMKVTMLFFLDILMTSYDVYLTGQ